ncbi:MAG: 3-methyl-2-oxobutanoate hydroxymethyltransferase [Candidatus Marinimicrobia bacterium]|jgi:3-methyl-2-oxobutanoate hydroxymethyltransferase|nr:3-methyl-2-oxobutanoate hydroxymethyltransferase [Candidatus Neomarinimicrobiota bacterium]MDP6852654.1 3-methyl-2-oxobutanoate hydroxymethyltransferase [Candidatus Neomarinimicrobiota bacterium]MDP6935932.1 3-methyl-2-oxobutanoate hydroxymethyltransferase [Candidatus Neomarinimicrobiota bacterium]
MKAKITIRDIRKFKEDAAPFATVTAYDYVSAQNADTAGIPLLLVGDSAAMVIYGLDNTIPISMDELIFLTRAVRRGAKNALVVADMPFMSYQPSVEDAVRNAGRFVKESGAEAVKLEGGTAYTSQITAIMEAGIPVMGHVGLLPQSYHLSSGYRIQGKSKLEAEKIKDDALAIQDCGAFAIVLEGIPADLAEEITAMLEIPTIGIGAGPRCDGQIQVLHDIIGLYNDHAPKHSKQFTNLSSLMQEALKSYKSEVENKQFPAASHYILRKNTAAKVSS